MKWTEEMRRREEAYLAAVEAAMVERPAGVRQEVLAELKDQLEEAVGQMEPMAGEGAEEALERVLAGMDAPEDFGGEGDGGEKDGADKAVAKTEAPTNASRRGPGGWLWFWLAVVFLLLNGYAVWRGGMGAARPDENGAGGAEAAAPTPEVVQQRVMRIRKVQTMNVSLEREVTLLLTFNSLPDRTQLARYLTLYAPGQGLVDFHVTGLMGSNTVAVETAPVMTEMLDWSLIAGMPSLEAGVVAMDQRAEGELKMEQNLVFRQAEANTQAFEEPYIRMYLNGYPDPDGLKRFVEVKPEVKFRVSSGRDYEGAYVELRGAFEPREIYEVTLKKGLPSTSESSLSQSVTRALQIPMPNCGIRLDADGTYLAPYGRMAIPVRTSAMKTFDVSISKVFPNNLARLAAWDVRPWYRKDWQDLEDLLDKTIEKKGCPVQLDEDGVTGHGEISLREITGEEEPRGAYWMKLTRDSCDISQLVVVTDLGLSVRMRESEALVWVNSLKSAGAVEGAKVSLRSVRGQLVAEGVTDADGLARLSWNEEDVVGEPVVVLAIKDDDVSYLALPEHEVPVHGDASNGSSWRTPGKLEASVFTERGVYRPGETVKVQALVRNDALLAPEPFPALWFVRRPDWKVEMTIPAEVDALGSAVAEVPMSDTLPAGCYYFELVMPGTGYGMGSTAISLEEFVPPQIRVAVQGPEKRIPASEGMDFTVRGDYLFGGAAEGLRVDAMTTFEAADFAPAAWPGWTFGDSEKSFSLKETKLRSQKLDAEGKAAYSSKANSNWTPPAALQLTLAATVHEAGGRTVSAVAHADVDVYPFYIGLRPEWTDGVRVATPQRISVVEVTPDGKGIRSEDAKPLVVKLSSVEWNSVMRSNSRGRYEWQSLRQEIEVRRDTLAVGGTPVDFTFEVESSGTYCLTFEDPASGASSRVEFYAGDGDDSWMAWNRERPTAIDLSWQGKGPWHVGDRARLLIRAPFAGEGLLTLEGRDLIEVRRLTLEKNTAEYEFTITSNWLPQVHATLTLIRPAKPEGSSWSAHRASGAVRLMVAQPEKGLSLEMTAPQAIRPQSPLDVEVCVRDSAGQPVQGGAVTVMAVDEGLCLLTGFSSPNPLKWFLRPFVLNSALYDFYGELMPPLADEDSPDVRSAPGGGAPFLMAKRLNPVKANRFKPVALWKPAVPLDEEGRARIQLDVPEFTGELRLMAVAYTAGAVGAKQSAAQVRRGLIVQPALPRFMAPKDVCTASIPLYNRTSNTLHVVVRLTCGGPLGATPGEQTLDIPAGGSAMPQFELRAGQAAGKALCRVEVTAGAESYGETFELSIRPAGGLSYWSTNGILPPGGIWKGTSSTNWLTSSVYATVHASALPSLEMCRALAYVETYPYGCLEQTVSGAFPLLRSEEWATRLSPGAWAAGDPSDRVRSAIARVLSMQLDDGGFAMWPFRNEARSDATPYAIHFLLEARAAGYAVPDEAIADAMSWLRARLSDTISPSCTEDEWMDEMRERATACHLLALGGAPDAAWISRLCENTSRLDFEGRIQLACALLQTGKPRMAADLLESLDLPSPRRGGSHEMMNSAVREAALLLAAWLEIDAEHPAVMRLAEYLRSRRMDGHWGNTQDNAMALYAFGKLARHLPAKEEDIAGFLSITGADGSVKGREKTFDHTRDVVLAGERAANNVELRNTGTGPLYYQITFEGVASEPPAPCAQNFTIEREFLDWEGKPFALDNVQQGDLFIVRLTAKPHGAGVCRSDIVIEDLLPAGLEIENPALATSQSLPWIERGQATWERSNHNEARDDRMLYFIDTICEPRQFLYAVRAVTPGTFLYPPATASGMYDPAIRAVGPAASNLTVGVGTAQPLTP